MRLCMHVRCDNIETQVNFCLFCMVRFNYGEFCNSVLIKKRLLIIFINTHVEIRMNGRPINI